MIPTAYDQIADLYDNYVQSTFDIDFFVNEARQANGEILELMAGTGRVTLPLVAAGAHLTAVDNAAAMLAKLQEKLDLRGLQAELHTMDVRHFDLRRQFAQVIIPFHAFPEITDPHDQRAALAAIKRHLQPGGRFICTLHNPPVRLQSVDGKQNLAGKFSLPDGGTLLLWLLQTHDRPANRVNVLEFFEVYAPDGTLSARRLLELSFSLLGQQQFEALIAEAGFRVMALYGGYDYTPFDPQTSRVMIYVLEHAVN